MTILPTLTISDDGSTPNPSGPGYVAQFHIAVNSFDFGKSDSLYFVVAPSGDVGQITSDGMNNNFTQFLDIHDGRSFSVVERLPDTSELQSSDLFASSNAYTYDSLL